MNYTTDNTTATGGTASDLVDRFGPTPVVVLAAGGTASDLVDRFGPTPVVVLAVWSHPDDESFLAGGLLAEYAARGARVVNVNATSGEHGTQDPIADPPAVLAARREAELGSALDRLGAVERHSLGYEDGTCEHVPDALGARSVGAVIDQVRPDLVVTFDRCGVTGHPDHQAIHRWTLRAVAERDNAIPVVLASPASAWPRSCIDALHTIGAFWPGYPDQEPAADGHVVRLDATLTHRKLAALACHASQMVPVERALGTDGFRLLASIEAYRPGNRIAAHHMSDELVPTAA